MSNVVTRTLVATLARIDADFPASGPHSNRSWASMPGIMSAEYDVDLDGIKTMLGRFLAEHTDTTQRDDDASRVHLLSPWTIGDADINRIATNAGMTEPSMSTRRGNTLERLGRIRADIERMETRLRTMKDHVDVYRTFGFDWPVFGSVRVAEAETPEQFYDLCARMIRQTGAVIISAGLKKVPLTDGLAQTMANGRGLALLRASPFSKANA